jgi:outer membrane biosynthesis protein TonB
MTNFDEYNFDNENRDVTKTAWQKNRAWILTAGVLGAVVGGVFAFAPKKADTPPRKPMDAIVAITLPPLPPPIVQPTPTPEPKEQEMVKQDEIIDEEPPDEPTDDGPDIAATATGPGKDSFGVGGRKPGSGTKKVIGSKNTRGKYDRFAKGLQSFIADALRKHPKTMQATMTMNVRIWADQSGRVTKASLEGSTGDSTVDAALRNDVLVGLQLNEPPPADMPMPIVMQVQGRRPN